MHFDLLLPFIDALKAPNVSLTVHDGCSGLSWSGGRKSGRTIEPAALDDVLEQYRWRGVGFNLLFSSHLLRPDDLANEYGNLLLQKLLDERNGVVVCDGVLADYVRERYPKYRLIRSVINAYPDEVIYRCPHAIVRYFQEKVLALRSGRVGISSALFASPHRIRAWPIIPIASASPMPGPSERRLRPRGRDPVADGSPVWPGALPPPVRRTSCFRYWGQGIWTDYGRELAERAMAHQRAPA